MRISQNLLHSVSNDERYPGNHQPIHLSSDILINELTVCLCHLHGHHLSIYFGAADRIILHFKSEATAKKHFESLASQYK